MAFFATKKLIICAIFKMDIYKKLVIVFLLIIKLATQMIDKSVQEVIQFAKE